MKDKPKPIFNKLVFSGIIILIILLMQPLEVAYFFKDIDVLFPKGMIGIKQRNLLVLIQALMLLFIVPIYIFTFLFSWWYRADNDKSKYDPQLIDNRIAEYFWWGIPLVMTVIVCIITWIKTHELDPYKPIKSDKKPIVIETVALQWKWLFIYPEEKIAVVNYIQIPKETPIHFKITADAPMNSLWIPSLGGQIYAMPGMQTQLHLIANEEGKFDGSSANISGKGFAEMTFVTEASSEEAYKKWLEKAKQSEKNLNWETYKKLSEPTVGSPVEVYRVADENLFQKIIMKFMNPQES